MQRIQILVDDAAASAPVIVVMIPLPTRFRFNHAGIDCKTLATDQAFLDASPEVLLEDKAERFRLVETNIRFFENVE